MKSILATSLVAASLLTYGDAHAQALQAIDATAAKSSELKSAVKPVDMAAPAKVASKKTMPSRKSNLKTTDNGFDQTPSGIKPKPPVPPKDEPLPQGPNKPIVKANQALGQTPSGIRPKPPVPTKIEGIQQNQK
jgi:hypothetical protein